MKVVAIKYLRIGESEPFRVDYCLPEVFWWAGCELSEGAPPTALLEFEGTEVVGVPPSLLHKLHQIDNMNIRVEIEEVDLNL